MSAAILATPSTDLAGEPLSTRVTSIDIFRGFTMAVMIFVNDLSDVRGLSRWTYHMPRDVDAMSYVDMVFPFFLFVVGIALPLAIQQRLKRDPSLLRLWQHIALRCFALLVLGLTLANADRASKRLMHMRPSLWALLMLAGAILVWAAYPKTMAKRRVLLLRLSGALILVLMLAWFRSMDRAGNVSWLRFRYPEILGLIGLTYVAVCLLYVPLRKHKAAPLACFGLLLLLNIACAAHWTSIHETVPLYAFPFGNGAMPAITMAGVVVSAMFLGTLAPPEPRRKILQAVAFAVVCFLLGWMLRPLGISKIRATPTWALWSVSAATLCFAFFYWLCDMRQHTRWAGLLRSAGSNALLTYLLSDIAYYTLSLLHLSPVLGRLGHGLAGITRAVCFTVAVLLVARKLTRSRLRLQI